MSQNDSPKEITVLLTLEPEKIEYLWKALAQFGLKPDATSGVSSWHVTRHFPRGVPLTFEGSLPKTPFRLSIRNTGPPKSAEFPWTTVELELMGPNDRLEEGRELMERLQRTVDEEARTACLGAEVFLGRPPDFAWHTMSFSAFFLPSFHEALDAELQGWIRLKVDDPRGGRAQTLLIHDASGKERSVYSSARFYCRRESHWLVCDLTTKGGHVEFSIESAGLPKPWAHEMLKRLEDRLTDGSALLDRRMTPSGEELTLDRAYTWDDLFLDPEVKDQIRGELEQFFGRRELYDRMGLPHRRGILLHGPPGTGKTLVGKILASTLKDCVFIWITASDISSAKDVASLFRMARTARRTILFFEDLDLYAAQRAYDDRSAPLGELLVQLDGMRSNQGMIVIATTNDLHAIEPALKDRPMRFDRLLEFGPATGPIRHAHLRHLLANVPYDEDALKKIVAETEGMTGAQLQELAFSARCQALDATDGSVGLRELKSALASATRFKAAPAAGFGPGRKPLESADDDL